METMLRYTDEPFTPASGPHYTRPDGLSFDVLRHPAHRGFVMCNGCLAHVQSTEQAMIEHKCEPWWTVEAQQ
jgi:hypothetical protein